MAFSCSIVVAGILCVQAPIMGTTTATIEDAGLWVADSVVFDGKGTPARSWKVSTGRSMEWAPPRIDTAKLSKACAGDACQTYWRNCDDAAHPKKCSFTIDEGGGVARTITVEAPDKDGLKDALANTGVLSGGKPIPFAAMDQEAPGTNPPYLPAEGPTPF